MAPNEDLVKEQDQSYEITDLQNQPSALAVVTKAEVDMQITTAHTYPRSLSDYSKKAMAMLTMNEEIASECFYVLPRAGKTIEGPSVRLAEIVASAYKNMRYGGRVVGEDAENVIAQGVCHDLENNVAVTMEVKRKILDRNGRRYNADMVTVTGNAASSIAMRNAIFRIVPKVLWLPLYEKARKVAKGDEKTFEVRREATLVGFERLGAPRKKVFDYLKIKGVEDMTSDHLITLIGIGNAIKSGEATIADFDKHEEPSTPREMPAAKSEPSPEPKEAAKETKAAAPAPAAANGMFDSNDPDPFLAPAEINQFWDKAFAANWKKSEVMQFLKKDFKVDAIKDLRRSQAKSALDAIQQAKD